MLIKEIIFEAKPQTPKPRNFVAKAAQTVAKGAGAHKDKKRAEKSGDTKHKKQSIPMENALSELSTEKLGQYKKAAGADAKKADAGGDYARGDKRFKGINKATNKQFSNDLKKQGVAEDATAGATSAANIAIGPVYKNKPAKSAKNKDGTAKNALDMPGTNLITGGSIKRR